MSALSTIGKFLLNGAAILKIGLSGMGFYISQTDPVEELTALEDEFGMNKSITTVLRDDMVAATRGFPKKQNHATV